MEKKCPIDDALRFIETGDHKRATKSLLKLIGQDSSNYEAFNILGTLYANNEPEKALKCFQRAIQIKPDFALALYNLANINKKLGNIISAIKYYLKAIKLDPSIYQAYFNLGVILIERGNFSEAAGFFIEAIKQKPDYAEALTNLGVCYYNIGLFERARTYYEKAIDANPSFADAHFNLAMSLLMSGEYDKGWDEYRWRWKTQFFKERFLLCPISYSNDIFDKRLLVFAEQGYGDSLQFVRYLKPLNNMTKRLILVCPQSLRDLFINSFHDVLIVNSKPNEKEYDLCIPLMDLPYIFRTTIQTIPKEIPYIKPSENLVCKYKEYINSRLSNSMKSEKQSVSKFKIGIVWHGDSIKRRGLNRILQPKDLFPLLSNQACVFFSLMKEPHAELEKKLNFIDMSERLTDFHETAALIANLDLVITIDTAVAHLAGAMGKPVWLMLHYTSDWRWMLHRNDSPWYPTMKIFRQNSKDNWDNVIEEVTKELSLLAAVEIPDSKKGFYDQEIISPSSPKQKSVSETEAMDYYRGIIYKNPLNAHAHWELALLLLKNEKFDEGWAEYEWRKRLPEYVGSYPNLPIPEWTGEDISGKSIFIYDEQGFGDAIQFIRYTKSLINKKASVYVLCRKELKRLLDKFIYPINVLQRGKDFSIKADYLSPMMSLPLYINLEDPSIDIPYFVTNEEDKLKWSGKVIDNKQTLKVGLCWSGRAKHINDATRSMRLEDIFPLLELQGISFYSLQKQEPKIELFNNYNLKDYTSEFNDFYDTACFISNLDLVITVDTAVAHLAGALGKETWLMLPFNAEWRWFKDEHRTPWYPTMRLFRQSTPGDWSGVIDRIISNIKTLKG